ncbi:MAG: IclR family transcriptional regulator [Paenibacillaceae bacterium]
MEDAKLTVRAVERALDILLCFTNESDLGLTELASRVGLHKSTVHRLLASLEGKGFIIRDPASEKYKLGYRVWELSANLMQSDDMSVALLPEMERLRDVVGETISLYVRDGHERIRIQAVQSRQAVRRVAPVGARLPLVVGASSKILVAYADKANQDELLEEISWPEGMNRKAFVKQLAHILEVGYATSIEEREPGAAAVAAPIYNRTGEVVAALSVSGPANRLTADKMQEQAEIIIESAKLMGRLIR